MTDRKIILTRDQVIDLLTCAAAYDKRTIGEADIAAWTLAIGDLPFGDAQAAIISHYSEGTDWLMPAHVRQRVKLARELNIARHPIPPPPAHLADTPPAYRDELQNNVSRLADGMQVPKRPALGSGAPPSAEYNQVRGIHRDPIRVASKQVRCPWETCKAPIGSACTTSNGRPLDRPAHDARLVAAGVAEWVEVNGVQRAVIRQQGAA